MRTKSRIRFLPGQLVICENSHWYNTSSELLEVVANGPIAEKEYTVNLYARVQLKEKWLISYCVELKEFPGILYPAAFFRHAMPLKSISRLEQSLALALKITTPQRN